MASDQEAFDKAVAQMVAENEPGAVLPFSELRRYLPRMSKKRFDTLAIRANRKGNIVAHYVDLGHSPVLEQSVRDGYVYDESADTYYVGFAPKRAESSKIERAAKRKSVVRTSSEGSMSSDQEAFDKAMAKMVADNVPGALLPFSELRKYLPRMSKKRFDTLALRANRKGKIVAHYSALGHSPVLEQSVRDGYVYDESTDTYYLGFAPKRAEPTDAPPAKPRKQARQKRQVSAFRQMNDDLAKWRRQIFNDIEVQSLVDAEREAYGEWTRASLSPFASARAGAQQALDDARAKLRKALDERIPRWAKEQRDERKQWRERLAAQGRKLPTPEQPKKNRFRRPEQPLPVVGDPAAMARVAQGQREGARVQERVSSREPSIDRELLREVGAPPMLMLKRGPFSESERKELNRVRKEVVRLRNTLDSQNAWTDELRELNRRYEAQMEAVKAATAAGKPAAERWEMVREVERLQNRLVEALRPRAEAAIRAASEEVETARDLSEKRDRLFRQTVGPNRGDFETEKALRADIAADEQRLAELRSEAVAPAVESVVVVEPEPTRPRRKRAASKSRSKTTITSAPAAKKRNKKTGKKRSRKGSSCKQAAKTLAKCSVAARRKKASANPKPAKPKRRRAVIAGFVV